VRLRLVDKVGCDVGRSRSGNITNYFTSILRVTKIPLLLISRGVNFSRPLSSNPSTVEAWFPASVIQQTTHVHPLVSRTKALRIRRVFSNHGRLALPPG
jgi:hypothetical protein